VTEIDSEITTWFDTTGAAPANNTIKVDYNNQSCYVNPGYHWYVPFTPQPQPQYHYIYQTWPTPFLDAETKAKIEKLEKEVLELKELVVALANHLGIGKK